MLCMFLKKIIKKRNIVRKAIYKFLSSEGVHMLYSYIKHDIKVINMH